MKKSIKQQMREADARYGDMLIKEARARWAALPAQAKAWAIQRMGDERATALRR